MVLAISEQTKNQSFLPYCHTRLRYCKVRLTNSIVEPIIGQMMQHIGQFIYKRVRLMPICPFSYQPSHRPIGIDLV